MSILGDLYLTLPGSKPLARPPGVLMVLFKKLFQKLEENLSSSWSTLTLPYMKIRRNLLGFDKVYSVSLNPSTVLADPGFISYVDENFVFYVVDVNKVRRSFAQFVCHPQDRNGNAVCTTLGITTFPSLSVVCYVSNSQIMRQSLANLGYGTILYIDYQYLISVNQLNSSQACVLQTLTGVNHPRSIVIGLKNLCESHEPLLVAARAEVYVSLLM